MQEVVLGKALKVSNCRGKLPRKCKRTWYPNVSIHTLHAVLCIFTEVLTRRICQFNQFNQFYLNSHEYSVLEKVIIITVRSVTNINIKNSVQSEKKKQNNRNNLQFIVTKDI